MPMFAAASAISCLISCVWVIAVYFRRPERIGWRMRLLSISGLIGFAIHIGGLILIDPSQLTRLPIACGLYTAGFCLLWWSVGTLWNRRPMLAFSNSNPVEICMSGPYAWVRHPFYLSYVLMWLAGAVSLPLYLGWFVLFLLLPQYIIAIRSEEQQILSGPHGAAYSKYRRKVGAMIPTFRNVTGDPLHDSEDPLIEAELRQPGSET